MPPSLISHDIPLVGTQILLVTCIRLIGHRVSVTLRPHHRDVRHIPGSASKHHAQGLTDVNGYRHHLFWTSLAPCRYGQPSHGCAFTAIHGRNAVTCDSGSCPCLAHPDSGHTDDWFQVNQHFYSAC